MLVQPNKFKKRFALCILTGWYFLWDLFWFCQVGIWGALGATQELGGGSEAGWTCLYLLHLRPCREGHTRARGASCSLCGFPKNQFRM